MVTAAEMLSVAAFLEGQHAQAFPSFGSERMGAPVVAFCRIADKEIRLREPIKEPDALIVQDPTLLRALDVSQGLKGNGFLMVNRRGLCRAASGRRCRAVAGRARRAVPATDLAVKFVGRPVPNAALLGAFAADVGIVVDRVPAGGDRRAFRGTVADANIAAAMAAHAVVAARAAA